MHISWTYFKIYKKHVFTIYLDLIFTSSHNCLSSLGAHLTPEIYKILLFINCQKYE